MPIEHKQSITVNNSLQNLGQITLERPNALGNVSLLNPTIEQMNAGITRSGGEVSDSKENQPEPAFGEHLHEAADVLRRILR